MGKNIKTLRRFLALVMAFGVVAGLCACTQQSSSSAPPSATSSESQTPDAVVAEWPDFLTVGGGSTGGVFFSAAAGIAQLLSSETDTTATAQTTTGGSQNIQLIANGEMELGIAAADACYQAWNGIGSYEKPLQEMNVICAIYSSYYQHVVRNDSKAQSFEEMAGSTQVVGGSGSGTEVSARAVLGAYGYDYLERKDLKAEFLGISEGVEKIQNKQADGMNSITPYPFSSFVELTMTDNAHLISINDEALDKLVNAEGSVYMKGIIPPAPTTTRTRIPWSALVSSMTATVANTAKTQLPEVLMTNAHTTPANATPEPADRSVLPETISIVMPQESTPMTVHWVNTLKMLSVLRKRLDTREATSTTSAKIRRMPKRLNSSARLAFIPSFCFIFSPLPRIPGSFPVYIPLCAIRRKSCLHT